MKVGEENPQTRDEKGNLFIKYGEHYILAGISRM